MDRRVPHFIAALVWGLSLGARAEPSAAAGPPASPAAVTAPSSAFDLASALRRGDTPMTADRAAELARASAPDVEAARAARRAAEAAARGAVVAAYPRLDLAASYTRLSDVDPGSIDVPGLPVVTGDVEFPRPLLDRYGLEARVSYPVSDLFFAILPRHRAAQQAADVERLNASAREHGVSLSAREAFYNYARAKAARAVAETGLEQARARLADVEAFVATGSVPRVEQMRAAAAVASAEVAVARADGSVSFAHTALATLMHLPGEGELSVEEDLSAPLPPLEEADATLIDQGLRSRSEVRALQRLLESQEAQGSAYRGDQLPHLGVAASVGYDNPSARVFPEERRWTATWSLSAQLTWSPNDLASGSAGADRVAAQRAATQAELRALEDALRVEVGRASVDYRASRRAMEAARVGVQAAEEGYRVRREQFRAGAAVHRDLIDAEAELRRARLELVNAAIDARIAQARLDRALER